MRRVPFRAIHGVAVATAAAFAFSAFVACGDDDVSLSPGDDAATADAGSSDAGAMDATEKDVVTGDAAAWPAPVACGDVLPGPPLAPNVTEAEPGYADQLAETDASGVPDPFDYSGQSKLIRGVAHYMFEESPSLPSTKSRAEATEHENMGRAFFAAAARGQDGGLSVPFLRRGLYYHYACSRPLPASLDELRARYGDYQTWPDETIDCSKPKNGPRRIHSNATQGVYVSETLVDGGIRETEVIFTQLRTDGQLDFAAYTPDGHLTDRSTFATTGGGTVTAAAPYICMSCHLNSATGGFSVLRPTGTGAGCKDAGP